MNRSNEIKVEWAAMLEDVLILLVLWKWVPAFTEVLEKLLWYLYDHLIL